MPSASWDERVMDGERHDAHAAGSVPDDPLVVERSTRPRNTCTSIRSSTSSALTETTGSSRTTPPWCGVSRSAAW